MTYQKKARSVDRKLLDTYHRMKCVACGKSPCDPAHIVSRGAGGDDVPWNVMALCRRHHSESHAIGWYKFAQKYLLVRKSLAIKGWAFDENFALIRKN